MAQLVDQFGNVIPRRPPPHELSVRTIQDRVRDRQSLGSILTSVTPERIVGIFREADQGIIGRQVELAQDLVERDAHLLSVCQTRSLGVQTLDWVIEAGDEHPDSAKCADAFRHAWDDLDTQSLIDDLMDAVLQQWAVARVIWDTEAKLDDQSYWTFRAFEQVDVRRLVWPQAVVEEPGDITPVVPAVSVDWSITNTEPLSAGKYLAHSYRAKRGQPGRGALVRAIALYWMLKRFSLVDFGTLLEQYGRPWRAIKYDPSATSEQIDTWLETLRKAAADMAVAIPLGAELELVQAAAAGADVPHANLIRLCDENMSKAIIGSTTIAEAAASSESVSSPTHAKVRADIRNADAKAIGATIRRDLAVPFTLWNGHLWPEAAAPKITPDLADRVSPDKRSQVFLNAAQLRLRVNAEQLYSDLALERPPDVPDVIELDPGGVAAANPFAGLFGDRADGASIANRTRVENRTKVADTANDPQLGQYADLATAAAASIGDGKLTRLTNFIEKLHGEEETLGGIRGRLAELLPRIESADEEELNRQLVLASELQGRADTQQELEHETDES